MANFIRARLPLQTMKSCGNQHGVYGQVPWLHVIGCVARTDDYIYSAIIGLQGFFPLKGEAAVGVGAVEYPIAERKRLAAL